MNETWIVYRHTSPSGKVYIGITSRGTKESATANHIAECCRGKRKRCLNYKWIYNYD